jgi:hypothetical protein
METSAVQQAKLEIMASVGLSKDALHVYVGLTVFLIALYLLRRRPRSLIPLLVVALIAVLGEIVDARDDVRSLGNWRWRASLHDVWNTLFWPSVLWTFVRLRVVTLRTAKKDLRNDA